MSKCVLCNKDSEKRCARCGTEKYCSKECQISHWETHKLVCVPKKEKKTKEIVRCVGLFPNEYNAAMRALKKGKEYTIIGRDNVPTTLELRGEDIYEKETGRIVKNMNDTLKEGQVRGLSNFGDMLAKYGPPIENHMTSSGMIYIFESKDKEEKFFFNKNEDRIVAHATKKH